MERVTFRLGEKKYVDIQVSSCNGKEVVIDNAKYVLRNGSETEMSGECDIQRESDTCTVLSALIQPQIAGGTYILEYTYNVPPETLKHVIGVSVI